MSAPQQPRKSISESIVTGADLHRDRQNDTQVCEEFEPAITKETIVPVESVKETIAVDREVHLDHYQTRIQPVEEHIRDPEKHEHHTVPVEYREKLHGKDEEIKRKLEAEAQQFQSTTTVLPTARGKVETVTVEGEHIHHHVHERVQPVIEREVVQPTVIHTTIPVHERVEHEPTFHSTTVQPKMTMEEYRRAGGILEGRGEICQRFEGEPQIKKNGGANQTHPNAYEAKQDVEGRRPMPMRMASGGSERIKETEHVRAGVHTPPLGAI